MECLERGMVMELFLSIIADNNWHPNRWIYDKIMKELMANSLWLRSYDPG
jgi:hypothetical protein